MAESRTVTVPVVVERDEDGVWCAWPVRLGGSLYTFFGANQPESLIGPPGVLTLVWIALLAGEYRPEQETAPAVTA
jgi:hypothetical protein